MAILDHEESVENSNAQLKKILYIDDDSDMQLIFELALKEKNYDLKICSSGQEALDSAAAFQPDLIITDVMMPDMDGPTTIKKLREVESLKNIPVIFLTARTEKEEIQRYKDLGAKHVLIKPFNPMTLSEEIERIYNA